MPPSDTAPRVLVAFASRHGATRGVAERVRARLVESGLDVDVLGVQDVARVPPGSAVVLGSPVYDQRWPPEADDFVRRHADVLAACELWVFSVGTFGDRRRWIGKLMTREPRGIDELREALRPRDYRVFAGVIRREQWPLPSRMLYHLFGGRLGDNRDWREIDAWADGIARALDPTPVTAGTRA